MQQKSKWVLTNTRFCLYYISVSELQQIQEFLDECRNKLDRIEFFYPYQNDELKNVVEHGKFLGVYDEDKLIATVGLDIDKTYAKLLADRVSECTKGRLAPTYAYEVSGLMIDEHYRGQGLGKSLVKEINKIAPSVVQDGWLCSVVQIENVASMKAFLSNGYVLAGIYRMGGEYDFGYFVRPVGQSIQTSDIADVVAFRDMDKHLEMLSKGAVGTTIRSIGIEYRYLANKPI